jgi:hypothetical protein
MNFKLPFFAASLFVFSSIANASNVNCKAMIEIDGERQEAIFMDGFTGYSATIHPYFFLFSSDTKGQGKLSIVNMDASLPVYSNEFTKLKKGQSFLSKVNVSKQVLLMVGCQGQ